MFTTEKDMELVAHNKSFMNEGVKKQIVSMLKQLIEILAVKEDKEFIQLRDLSD